MGEEEAAEKAVEAVEQVTTGLVSNYAWITIAVVGGLIVILMIIALVLIATNKMEVETWHETSLGIPRGSVRALLALFFCFIAIGVWITTKEMPAWLIGILGAIIGFYFGSKATSERPKT